MDMWEILKNLSFLSIAGLVFMVVAGLGIILFMTNLIPGFGMMAEETESTTHNDHLLEGEEKLND